MIRFVYVSLLAFSGLALVLTGCSSAAIPAASLATPATENAIPTTSALPVTVTYTPGGRAEQEFRAEQPATASPTDAPSLTLPLMAAPGPTQAEITPYPPEHYLTGIFGHKQFFSLGCEAGVAKDWAAYFGVEINEFHFQYELPLSDNPDKGFVGSVDGPWGQVPPYAYGVHAGPVADLLRRYGLPAAAYRSLTIERIKKELAEDDPVIAWVIGNVVGGVPAEYTDKEGDTVIVAAYEHVVLVTGYNEKTLRYNSNGRFYDVPVEVFENSWAVLGNMAIVYE